MSIVLIDRGADPTSGPAGLAALADFPHPLTFAVDPNQRGARDRMRIYREAGHEVLALVNLPAGATGVDAEVNISEAWRALPEAVGLLEGPDSGVQDSEDAGEALLNALRDSGHGLVLQAKGLNALQRDAERTGLPSRVVFRDFDSADQNARVIRRFLDQAAFRAGQEGGVIMMGRMRPDTISALLLWGLQERAQRVAIAPISAVLTQ